ncbi:DUF2946 domain-containing protein [Pseudomonas sp. PB3P13]
MRPLSVRTSMQRRPSVRLTRASWISLFAMLMIFIGPLISQSMPMDQRAAAPMNVAMSLSMDMPAMEHGEHHAQAATEDCAPKADHHALWEKCGYCSLLFNCPALTGSPSFFTAGTSPATTFSAPATRLGHARQTFFPGARTRAPPILA